METAFVEEVAASLVREFLSKKGLSKTSSMMDQEFPRTARSINNRNELRKILHLQPLYKINKMKENPLNTILEIMTTYFLEKTISLQGPRSPQNEKFETSVFKSSFSGEDSYVRTLPQPNQTENYSYDINEEMAGLTCLSQRHRVENKKGRTRQALESLPAEGEKTLQYSRGEQRTLELSLEPRTAMREKLRTKPGLIIRGMMAGPTASFQEDSLKRRHLKRPSGVSNTAQLREEDNTKSCFGMAGDDFPETKGTARQSMSLLSLHSSRSLDIGKEHSSMLLLSPQASRVDGKAKNSIQDENDLLSRRVSDRPQDEVRKSASSCDMEANEKSYRLTAFQRPLGDGSEKKESSPRRSESQFSDCSRSLQPSEAHRTKCLALALTNILWRAGSSEKATVALCSETQQFTPVGKYKADGILETIMLHIVTKYEDLLRFLQQNIFQFESGPHGCILLTLSAILSRSINQVRGDFDVITNQLIGAHGYCTQELVNLLLTGKAVSNVFNDVIELDSGNGNTTALKGISGRCDIGLLSLFEHYDVCQVGCYLKTPKFPIWLVCSESHFSVLFSMRKDLLGDWKTELRFDLYYYDGLANQQEEIRLTIGIKTKIS